MALVGTEFLSKVTDYQQTWLPARELVATAINSRLDVRHLMFSTEINVYQ